MWRRYSVVAPGSLESLFVAASMFNDVTLVASRLLAIYCSVVAHASKSGPIRLVSTASATRKLSFADNLFESRFKTFFLK